MTQAGQAGGCDARALDIQNLQLRLEIHRCNGARQQQIDQVTSQLESYQMKLAELHRKAERLRSELDGLGVQKP